MKEKSLERMLVRAVKQSGGVALKFVSPGTAGVPDRLVLLPGGRIRFVEMKAPGEKPTALQRLRHAQLRDLGFRVAVADSAESVRAFAEETKEAPAPAQGAAIAQRFGAMPREHDTENAEG